MDHRTKHATVQQRLEKMLELEGVDRQRRAALWVTVALVLIAPLIVVLAGFPDALYYHVLLLLFVTLAWTQYLLARRWPTAEWIDYVFVALIFALLAFTLISPNPLSDLGQYEYGVSVGLRSNNFIYFFLFLATLTFSFSPWLLVWGGVCGALMWSLGRLWVISQPGIELFSHKEAAETEATFAAVVEASQHPRYVDLGIWIQEVIVLFIVAVVLALVVNGSRELLLRRALEERRGANLSRYLPAPIAQQIAEADTPFLNVREAEAAVLFTDMVGFTRWAQHRSPQEVVALLRDLHGLVAEEVFRAEGVLDKFIGDGAMATFGVADTTIAPAARAMECVDAILRRMDAYNDERLSRGEEPVLLSMGAHHGRVTVGDVGTEERLEMAVIGDAVNVASRLEELTRTLDVAAVVSDDLIAAAGGPPAGWTAQGTKTLPGRAGLVGIWVRSCGPGDVSSDAVPASSALNLQTVRVSKRNLP
ncbi:MAG: adenylate/guanylate cyclase domain-containing protein [Pseudomonadota bacterium]